MQRYSKQRELVLNYLCGTTAHPTAETIYSDLKPVCPSISLATVYRNLNLLVDNGLALRLDTGEQYARYDANTDNHYHFVCSCCHRVTDIFDGVLDNSVLTSIAEEGCKISGHKLFIYGVCAACAKKQSASASV